MLPASIQYADLTQIAPNGCTEFSHHLMKCHHEFFEHILDFQTYFGCSFALDLYFACKINNWPNDRKFFIYEKVFYLSFIKSQWSSVLQKLIF